MQPLLDRYCNFHRVDASGVAYTTSTRMIRVESGIASAIPGLLDPLVPAGAVAIVMDANTRLVAGDDLVGAFARAGRNPVPILLEPRRPAEEVIVCDDARISDVEARIREAEVVHAVAVGAGTINDLVKMATHRIGIDFSSLATAPSMNGYTSSIAAILSEGVKITAPCHPTLAAFADPVVMAEAPYRMIASGIGDLYSKPVSNADWRLSDRLLGSGYSPIVMEVVEAGSALLDGVAARLPLRDRDAVARLTGALMLSGLAMQAAGSSGPASGGEHLVSHYIDMTAAAWGLPHDFHGCQVAVGTIATSRLYEVVGQMRPEAIRVDSLVERHVEWPDFEPMLRQRFGTLAPSVLGHARKLYPTRDVLRARLSNLVGRWDDILRDVSRTLRPSEELRSELDSAHCPTTFPGIGVDRQRGIDAVRWSKDIRSRYTILHLASELDCLEAFAAEWVGAQFGA